MRNKSTKVSAFEVKMCEIEHWTKERWDQSTIKVIETQIQVIQMF